MKHLSALKVKDQKKIISKGKKVGKCPYCNALMTLHINFTKSECICCGRNVIWDK